MRRHPVQLTAVMALLLAGCFRGANVGTKASPSVLRYALQEEPASIDPALSEAYTTSEVLQNIFEGLVILDQKSQPVPGIAERWEISPDGKTFTFHLRPSAKFHRPFSRPVTAADVKWSFERFLWPETKSPIGGPALIDIVGAPEVMAGKTRDLSGIKVLDSRTVSISLRGPRGFFLVSPAQTFIMCRESIEKNGGRVDGASCIGTGPFMLSEYRHGARIVLEANPEYWQGKPKVNRIERPIVLDPATAHLKYENGELDFLIAGITEFAQDVKNPKLAGQCISVPFANVGYIAMNPRVVKEFADRRVRRAIAMAIDSAEIRRTAFFGIIDPAVGILPRGTVGFNASLPGIPYDPAGAKSLLAEAGFPGGKGFPSLIINYVQSAPEVGNLVQVVRDMLRKNLDLTVDIQAREAATFYSDTGKGKLGFYTEGWVALDPRDYLSFLLRTGAKYNGLGYSNPEFDRLCDAGDTEVDQKRRAILYNQADQVAMRDAAIFPYGYPRANYLRKPGVTGLQFNLTGIMPHYTTSVSH